MVFRILVVKRKSVSRNEKNRRSQIPRIQNDIDLPKQPTTKRNKGMRDQRSTNIRLYFNELRVFKLHFTYFPVLYTIPSGKSSVVFIPLKSREFHVMKQVFVNRKSPCYRYYLYTSSWA
mmetsp:Transcript_11112/g.26706  ORF Transcript_11112/g.26706 Transcript_11112/m.26706 type:complete len:119 (-) Transcript_11112:142-498(-)